MKKQYGLITLSAICALTLVGCEATESDLKNIDNAFTLGGNTPATPDLPEIPPACFNDRFTQPAAEISRKIDLLFILDTSGSLDEERAGVAAGIDAFVAALPAEVDFQIGVMLAHSSLSSYSGKLYKQSTEPVVLQSKVHSMSTIRSALTNKLTKVKTDSYADGGEESFYALWKLLNPTNRAAAEAQGFFRADAAQAIVFISDEQDICTDYPAGVTPVYDTDKIEPKAKARDCSGINPQTLHTKIKDFAGNRPLLIAGLVYNDTVSYPRTNENEYGYGYMELIRLANGLAVDLADGNYDDGLAQIGTLATIKLNLQTQFTLAQPDVDASSIQVRVDGAIAPFNYLQNSNEVVPSLLGGALSTIDVTYCQKRQTVLVSELCQADSFVPKAQIKVGLSIDPNEGSINTITSGFASLGYPATVYTDQELINGKPTQDGITALVISRKVVLGPLVDGYVDAIRNYIAAGGSLIGEYDGAALLMDQHQGSNALMANMNPSIDLFTGLVDGGGLLIPISNAKVYNTNPLHPLMEGMPAEFSNIPRTAFALMNYDSTWLESPASFIASGSGDVPAGTYPAVLGGRCGKGRVTFLPMNHFQAMTQTPVNRLITNSLRWVTGFSSQ